MRELPCWVKFELPSQPPPPPESKQNQTWRKFVMAEDTGHPLQAILWFSISAKTTTWKQMKSNMRKVCYGWLYWPPFTGNPVILYFSLSNHLKANRIKHEKSLLWLMILATLYRQSEDSLFQLKQPPESKWNQTWGKFVTADDTGRPLLAIQWFSISAKTTTWKQTESNMRKVCYGWWWVPFTGNPVILYFSLRCHLKANSIRKLH